jgi:hypothetical protein
MLSLGEISVYVVEELSVGESAAGVGNGPPARIRGVPYERLALGLAEY